MVTFLYYARAVGTMILFSLNIISVEQSITTKSTAKAVTRILNYAATQSESITRYHTSGMVLHIHSNASFLSYPEAKIRVVRYHYLSMKSAGPNNPRTKVEPTQYTSVCQIHNHAQRPCKRDVSIIGRTFCSFTERCINLRGDHRNGPRTTDHPHSDGKSNRRQIWKQQNPHKTLKSHQHDILLVRR